MKTTTTPGGASLVWLEAGDTLQDNDLGESEDGPFTDWAIGESLSERAVALYRPRRYIPASE